MGGETMIEKTEDYHRAACWKVLFVFPSFRRGGKVKRQCLDWGTTSGLDPILLAVTNDAPREDHRRCLWRVSFV
ncbi:hypothetical protein THAOC_10050 [Thalassiosira oceanica]|uniref:Uncharacterized protein n=1 Tax=Thalassiosira oceanica TaxID=159749 RepID=K0SR81_THAOC|nr:hypothetical protein THAOC_10050 [Thalassiosira oceanica]|eukprot:EJK68743.1 hypothetical protein THAOC_10050 [Thalassiosira oceanica]